MEFESIKTLVVDDSGAMRRVLINHLSKLGIQNIAEAGRGNEALQEVLEADYDLVLMDYNMPDMNGIEAIQAIRAQGKTMPIVMVSTEGDKGHVLKALQAGANNYIVKPFTLQVFGMKLHDTLSRLDKTESSEEPKPPAEPKETKLSDPDSMKVLVVDDSASMRRILTRHLEAFGLKNVDEAVDGKEAVDAVCGAEYDFILMDLNMPNMNGIEAIQAIRGQGKTMPIIMVTYRTEKKDIIDSLAAGANNYLGKPFTPEVFMKKLSDTLHRAAGDKDLS
ncbi:MAG: response regulator [bacterium]